MLYFLHINYKINFYYLQLKSSDINYSKNVLFFLYIQIVFFNIYI